MNNILYIIHTVNGRWRITILSFDYMYYQNTLLTAVDKTREEKGRTFGIYFIWSPVAAVEGLGGLVCVLPVAFAEEKKNPLTYILDNLFPIPYTVGMNILGGITRKIGKI